jgi:Kef-type K+ transport system membrane component KefB
MIIPSLWFLKEFNYFNDLNNKSWFSLIKLFGLNFIFFLLSEMFHWKLLKNNFEEYDKLNGEYHEKITLMSVIFPLGIVFVVYQIITNIFTLL